MAIWFNKLSDSFKVYLPSCASPLYFFARSNCSNTFKTFQAINADILGRRFMAVHYLYS